MMKKAIYILVVVLLITALFGCTNSNMSTPELQEEILTENQTEASENKLSVVTTLFPQYDFARQIAGDKAEVRLLLPPGGESHAFEPTPADIIEINKADLFIYTDKGMETWAEKIIDSLENKNLAVLELSEGLTLLEGNEEHNHQYDPHIWTSPVIAMKMVQTIADKLCTIDSENREYYKTNAEVLLSELKEIDTNIRQIIENGNRKELYFGGHFALLYFTEEYGLTAHYAYKSHGDGSEPSIGDMMEMIEEIKTNNIPVIYYEELTDPKVARAISEETDAEILLFHSCHNISAEELAAGVTYADLMKQNAENLAKGLK